MRIPDIIGILVEAGREWLSDKAPRLAAALAFYTILSLAPLLVIATAIAALVFGEEVARGEIVSQLSGPLELLARRSYRRHYGMFRARNLG